jgi:hypothetical protein
MLRFAAVSERQRGERPKKSWREIDAQRDGTRGGGRDKPRDGASQHQADRASKQHRAALDALFAKGELGKLIEKMQPPPGAAPRAEPAAPAAVAPEPRPAPPPEPKADDPRSVLRKKVLAAIGREEISRAVDRYVKSFGLPEDFEILEQALEHNKNDRIAEALGVLEAMLATDKPKRSRTLQGKLRFIEETSDDAELRTHAAHVRSLLG